MKTIFALGVVALVATAFVPQAAASNAYTVTIPAPNKVCYVNVDDASAVTLWQESNDVPELQTEPTVNPDGSVTPSDFESDAFSFGGDCSGLY